MMCQTPQTEIANTRAKCFHLGTGTGTVRFSILRTVLYGEIIWAIDKVYYTPC